MGRCHYCINCGLCRGEKPKPILVPLCIHCGHENPIGSERCEKCDGSLELRPGETNISGTKGPKAR